MAFSASVIHNFINLDLSADSAETALAEIAKFALGLDLVQESWLDAVVKRESEFATGLPTAIPVAIPHTDSIHVRADGFGFFRLAEPVQFVEMGTTDSLLDVQLIFPLLITNPADQIDLLQGVISLIQEPGKLEQLMQAASPAEAAALLAG